jgi:hypothetical protein
MIFQHPPHFSNHQIPKHLTQEVENLINLVVVLCL